ncbi:hypothetical protein V495_00197 [Pseudogymnoascus sp. VKM F-4514 (FW-929)]|nr:hypothetical protein V495_00197 [Pseudogymnoascus sp. VKM F-4514 (FW-929)]KFY67315.1 hypothetical protein V497_00428 [Pseudogymnoascus sp. VKM F-4516 (FW-969)]
MSEKINGTPTSTPEAETDLYQMNSSRTDALLRCYQDVSENRRNVDECVNDLHATCAHLEKRFRGVCETYDGEKAHLQHQIARREDEINQLGDKLAKLCEENRVANECIASQRHLIETLQAPHHPEPLMDGLVQHGLMLPHFNDAHSGQYRPYQLLPSQDFTMKSDLPNDIDYSIGSPIESPNDPYLVVSDVAELEKTAVQFLLQPTPYETSAERDTAQGEKRVYTEKDRLLKPSKKHGPPLLSPVDKVINLHHGSTTAIEATHEMLVASKQYPVPSFKERIDQLERHGSNLNHEATYFRKMEPIRKKFKGDVSRWARELNDVLSKLDEIEQNVDRERALVIQTPQLSPVDRIISLYFDSTIDMEKTSEELPGPKQNEILAPPKEIEQLQRRNGSRTQEVAYLRRREPPMRDFKNKVSSIANKLERALSKLGKAQREVDREWVQGVGDLQEHPT